MAERGGKASVTVATEHAETTTVEELDWAGATWRQQPGDKAIPAVVEYMAGVTLQDERKYEMARFDVRVLMPCHPSAVDECFESVSKWTNRRLAQIKARHRAKCGE